MRILLLLSTIFALGSAVELPVVTSLMIRAAGETICPATNAAVCKDCHQLSMCINGVEMSSVDCGVSFPGQPYCNNGTCSATMPLDDDCGLQANFSCTAEGYYPDPDDCTRYYICSGSPLKASLYMCPSSPKHVYNHAKGMCVRQIVPADCVKMACRAGLVTEMVPYPKDPNIYGLCFAGKMTVLKCEPGAEMNAKTGNCEVKCNEEKLLPHEDKDKYIQCTYSSPNVYKPMVYKCPGTTTFDATATRCRTDPCGGGGSGGTGEAEEPEAPPADPEPTRNNR